MATEARHKACSLIQLQQEAADYEFFQLVRLAERLISNDANLSVQFKVSPKLAFPIAEIEKLLIEGTDKRQQLSIYVNFMGLVGHSGALPEHYTEYLVDRFNAKDHTLSAFLDIFHDRLLHLFCQVSKLSHFYLDYEQQRSHVLPRLLTAIAGNTANISSAASLRFCGLLSMQSRSSASLKRMLEAHFQLPIRIYQYGSEWLPLDNADITRVSKTSHGNQLSQTATLGKRTWHTQNRFTVVVGPLEHKTFLQLLPQGDMLPTFNQFIRAFCGSEYDYEIRLVLKGSALPMCKISKDKSTKLGWTTTLKSHRKKDASIQVKISTNKLRQVI